MPTHLFFTGDKQVGKSTLLNRLISHWGLRTAGLRTRRFHIDGQLKGHCLESLLPDWPEELNRIPCVIRINEKRCVGVIPAYEQVGAAMLEASRQRGAQLIVLDELGNTERTAEAFIAQIQACLDGPIPVVGVLQQCDFPLKEHILSRPDTRVITVTPENREALIEELKDFYR